MTFTRVIFYYGIFTFLKYDNWLFFLPLFSCYQLILVSVVGFKATPLKRLEVNTIPFVFIVVPVVDATSSPHDVRYFLKQHIVFPLNFGHALLLKLIKEILRKTKTSKANQNSNNKIQGNNC